MVGEQPWPGGEGGGRPVSGGGRRLVLAVLSAGSFTTVFNLLIISPLLVEIAGEFSITVPVAGSLMAVYALMSALLALVFGPLSDQYGRRPLMIFGLGTLVAASLGSAVAPTFPLLLAMRGLAGLGVAALQPSVLAAVADHFPYQERGTAMAWVVTANTMAGIFGVPVGTVLAGLVSWRWTFGLLTAVMALVFVIMVARFPRVRRSSSASGIDIRAYLARYRGILRRGSPSAALVVNFLGVASWHSWLTYLGAFFVFTYGLPTAALSIVLMGQGVGVLIGSNLFGRASDRLGKKRILVMTTLLSAVIVTLEANWVVAAWLGVLLHVALTMPVGARFAIVPALLTELVPEARGSMMSLNASAQQLGSMTGAVLGGAVIALGGYGLLGLASAGLAVLSALVLIPFVQEAGMRVAPAPVRPPMPGGMAR